MGLVTPLGGDVETTWANMIAGKSGAGPITRFDATDQKCTHRLRGEAGKDHAYGFDPDKRVDHKVQRQVDPFIVYGIDAAGQALEDAGLTDMNEDEQAARRLLDRLGHRRPAGDREGIASSCTKGARAASRRISSMAG